MITNFEEADILSPVPEGKKVHEDVQLVFMTQSTPRTKYLTTYKVPVPPELQQKIQDNLELFYQKKPFKAEVKIIVTVEHDS